MAQSKTSKTAVWILMGLLILGLGGFGATSLTGTIRSVGTVGDKDISVTDYSRALQEELETLKEQHGKEIAALRADVATYLNLRRADAPRKEQREPGLSCRQNATQDRGREGDFEI